MPLLFFPLRHSPWPLGLISYERLIEIKRDREGLHLAVVLMATILLVSG